MHRITKSQITEDALTLLESNPCAVNIAERDKMQVTAVCQSPTTKSPNPQPPTPKLPSRSRNLEVCKAINYGLHLSFVTDTAAVSILPFSTQ